MAVPKSATQGFVTNWDKRVAWAQAQGISRNDYYPIYQMDSARLMSGEHVMSNAEATRAILAAHNPNQVSQVPGQKPDPANVMGNTVSDLRSIFTGLAPNHLLGNLFDTVKNTIVHPETVIKPMEDVIGGAVSGNWGQVKQGLELGAGLDGPGSILSWLPGVYVAGEFAQGGVGEVLSHPVVSFLDVAPYAPAGRILSVAADESRLASMASRLGTTPDALREMSAPGMAKAWAMNTKVGDLPDFVSNRASSLVDARGNPLTIHTVLDNWIATHTGMGKTLSAIMKAMLVVNHDQTDKEIALMKPAELALQQLKPEQRKQVYEIVAGLNPNTVGKSRAEIRGDSRIDQQVRTAADLHLEVLDYIREHSIATGAVVPVYRLDGSTAFVHSAGEQDAVITTRRALDDATVALKKAMAPGHRLSQESRRLDAQLDAARNRLDPLAQRAEADVANLHGREQFLNYPTEIGGRRPRSVTLDLRKQANELFGLGAEARQQGLVYQVEHAIDAKDDPATIEALSAAVLRRLEKSGVGSLDANLSGALMELKGQMEQIHTWAQQRNEFDRRFVKELTDEAKPSKKMKTALADYMKAEKDFTKAVREHPTGDWVDVAKEKFIENLLKQEDGYHRMADFAKGLKARGVDAKLVDQLHQDPVKFAQLMVISIRALGNNPFGEQILHPEEEKRMWESAIDEANKLRESGHQVSWLPRITGLDVRDDDPGRFGVHISPTGKAVRSTRAFKRKVDITPERDDVVAALHLAAKEALQIDGTIEYADRVLSPHLVSGSTMLKTMLDNAGLMDEYHRLVALEPNNPAAALEIIMRDHFHMRRFEPNDFFGFALPRWSSDPNGMFIPESIAKALPKMLDKGQFPLDAAYQKATNLFRFSILKMSPRYTAHVLFGGTFLLALRSSPQLVRAIPEAWRIMRDKGELPRAMFERTSTQFGVDPLEQQLLTSGSQTYHRAGGSQQARLVAEENIEKVQKVPLREAKAVHWLKAVGDTNYKFTNWITAFQRATAYVDYINTKGAKMFRDPIDGETVALTRDRAHLAAQEHVNKVLGDLQAMTPLERSVFTTVLPFYGWTKHILEYVGSYPEDHPFRASVLSVMATQNSDSIASGLPTRIQFLFYLGSPDKMGNVSAVDVRALDPLRDVANYATLAGWISSLNPVITAPLAMIDPQIIFGGNSLYPTVTYDQFYGIETAGAQGSPVTTLEQFVPQVTALQAALATSGQFKQMAATNPNAFAKAIYSALNIPFAQVQHINLKQIAAKDEIDRYHVANQAATNAFQSGNFAAIGSLASVPDPLNADYEVTPGYLESLYHYLSQEYPGQPPAQTALPPPPAPI